MSSVKSQTTLKLFQKVKNSFLEPLVELTGIPFVLIPDDAFAGSPVNILSYNIIQESKPDSILTKTYINKLYALRDRARISGYAACSLFTEKKRRFLLFSVALKTKWSLLGFVEGRIDLTNDELQRDQSNCNTCNSISNPIDWACSRKLSRIILLLQCLSGFLATEENIDEHNIESPISPIILKAKDYIEAHLSDKLSVPIIANSVGLSESYFSKLFIRFTGLSLSRFVLNRRILRAQQLLDTTVKNISEVAFECGFESISHFNRSFKKYANLAPRQYRRNNDFEPQALKI